MRFVMERHVNSLRADSMGIRREKKLQWFLFDHDGTMRTFSSGGNQFIMLHTGKMGFRLA